MEGVVDVWLAADSVMHRIIAFNVTLVITSWEENVIK